MVSPSRNSLRYHDEKSAFLPASPERVFALIDDHERLSSHMKQSSWQMAGAAMTTTLDAGRGQRVGSHIRMSGRVLGVTLSLDEVVTERQPPERKIWETIGEPKLLVIGHYRMGIEVTPNGAGSVLRVFIDYARPTKWPDRWLSRLFGGYYAHWCTTRMADDAAQHFAATAPGATPAG